MGIALLPLSGEDNLRINSFGSLAGVQLAIEGRILDDDECLKPFAFSHTPNSDRSLKQTLHVLSSAGLQDIQVRATSGAPKRGQVFCSVELIRGLTASVQPLGVIAQGYVVNGAPLAWPGGRFSESVDGPGFLRSVTNAAPAAGADWIFTVPTGARWRPIALLASLVTSITVANRSARVVVDDGATAFAQMGGNVVQAASLTFAYTLASSNGLGAMSATDVLVPLPDWIVLLAGMRLRSSTLNLAAGDQWSAQQLLVEEWIEP